MKPFKHQEEISDSALEILRQYGIVYLAMEERTGKTLTAVLIAEKSKAKRILVLTKKKALDGWTESLDSYGQGKTINSIGLPMWFLKDDKTITVTNYHQAGKLDHSYELIILDESHSYLSAYPKVGKIWKDVYALTQQVHLVYLSATPNAQGYQLLFNQFRLSSWSPWKSWKNFYDWFREFGISNMVHTSYGLKETYTKCKPEVFETVKHLFITHTRNDLGFEHEPDDVLHYVELSEKTKKIYNNALKLGLLEISDSYSIFLDSTMKLRTSLHMLEGGVAKDDETYIVLDNDEKIQAILKDFGDSEKNVIMYHFKAEESKLKCYFKKTLLLQATSYAEGVDLSGYDNLIILSQDYSTARHSQRRARQANMNRLDPIFVHFYLVKKAISEQVYQTVSVNKTNYIDSMFDREELK